MPTRDTPPEGLDATLTAIWRGALKRLRDQGTWKAEQQPLLAEYVYALREAHDERALALEHPYHETDQGLIHPHPGFAIADRAVKRAEGLAKTLLLTPEAFARFEKAKRPTAAQLQQAARTPEEVAAEAFAELDRLAAGAPA